jgi:hypothetical protein
VESLRQVDLKNTPKTESELGDGNLANSRSRNEANRKNKIIANSGITRLGKPAQALLL